MGTLAPGEVTALLQAWRRGEQSALDRLVPVLYAELRRLAHRHMRGQPPGISVQTTMLVNEAYLRLAACFGHILPRPGALPGPLRATDAPDPGGLRPCARIAQARWRRLPDRVR